MTERADRVAWWKVRAYRRGASRPSVGTQVCRLLDDLDHLRALAGRGDDRASRGAALACARTALALSVTPVAEPRLRRWKRQVLRDEVVPALRGAGLGQVGALVEAALVLDGDPSTLARGAEVPQ